MKRIITAAIAIPLALAVTLYAPDWLFAALVAVLSALMLHEYFQMIVASGGTPPGRWFLLPGAVVAGSFALGNSWIIVSTVLTGICLMGSSIFTPVETALSRVTAGLSGVIYCSLLFGFII